MTCQSGRLVSLMLYCILTVCELILPKIFKNGKIRIRIASNGNLRDFHSIFFIGTNFFPFIIQDVSEKKKVFMKCISLHSPRSVTRRKSPAGCSLSKFSLMKRFQLSNTHFFSVHSTKKPSVAVRSISRKGTP